MEVIKHIVISKETEAHVKFIALYEVTIVYKFELKLF